MGYPAGALGAALAAAPSGVDGALSHSVVAPALVAVAAALAWLAWVARPRGPAPALAYAAAGPDWGRTPVWTLFGEWWVGGCVAGTTP